MLQNEGLKIFKEKAKEKDLDVTLTEAKLIMEILEETLQEAYSRLETNEKLALGCIKLCKAHKGERRGNGVKDGKPWVSPAKDVPALELKEKFVKENTIITK